MYPVINSRQLGTYLKSLRKSNGISQADLGVRMGVSGARISAIEQNPGTVSMDQLLRIFHTLGGRLFVEEHVSSNTSPGSVTSTGEW